MVLHVAGTTVGREPGQLRVLGPLEFGEDGLVGPADSMGQHVETPAVRHAQHHFPGSLLGGEFDHEIEHRDQHVHAFDGEPLVAKIGLVEEPFEGLHLDQPAEEPLLLVQ